MTKSTGTEKFKFDNNKGKIRKLACATCNQVTNHAVISSVEREWTSQGMDINGYDDYEIIGCRGCGQVSFRIGSSNSENFIGDPESGTYEYPEEEILFPNRIVGRKKIEESYLMPQDIVRIYNETHGALCAEFNTLAGMGIRLLIESVCRDKDASGSNLEKKIDDLVIKGVLTKENAETLHETRVFSNKAAHEAFAPLQIEVNIAMDIVENLLRSVFIIPKKAKMLNSSGKAKR